MPKVQSAGVSYQMMAFANRFRIKAVTKPGMEKGKIVWEVNPADEEGLKGLLERNVFDSALTKLSEGLTTSALVESAFQGFVVAGLVAGRGREARRELFSRVLPPNPEHALLLASGAIQQSKLNLRALRAIGGGGSSGGGSRVGGRVGGVGGDGDGDVGEKSSGSTGEGIGDSGVMPMEMPSVVDEVWM